MISHFFLFSETLTTERLSWLEESLKFYFIQIYPESLMYRGTDKGPAFTFFLTGDALSSLENPESQKVWSVILTLTAVGIVCDQQELDLRGINLDQVKMRNPGQIVDVNTLSPDKPLSFWNDMVSFIRQKRPSALPDTLGWLQIESPYMHRSAWYGLKLLFAALQDRYSIELYAYLDGIHMGHHSQRPTDVENIGEGLEDLCDLALQQNLGCQILACNRCAATRGYGTWDDGKGTIISTCGIKPFKIREINAISDRFRRPHTILSANGGSIQLPWKGSGPSFDQAAQNNTYPPLIILITKNPYTTEHAYGALSFAVSCAHQGVFTRVIFMEDGVYALTGKSGITPDSVGYNIQDLINAVAGNENLHLFALTPSFQKRGAAKNPHLKAVLEIGYPGLGKILFYMPGNVKADNQRVLMF